MAISLAIPSDHPPPDPKLVKLTSDAFLSELRTKVYEYYTQANTFMSVKGKRFEKCVIHSELWQAMAHLRFEEITGRDKEEEKRITGVEELPLSRSEVFISHYFLEAVSKGDWAAIEDSARLLKMMGENRARPPRKLSWHYYVGMAAWELLMVEGRPGWKGRGRLPTKMDVKKRAIGKRKKAERGKYKQPVHWDRIFNALKLGDLPSAQGEHSTHPTT